MILNPWFWQDSLYYLWEFLPYIDLNFSAFVLLNSYLIFLLLETRLVVLGKHTQDLMGTTSFLFNNHYLSECLHFVIETDLFFKRYWMVKWKIISFHFDFDFNFYWYWYTPLIYLFFFCKLDWPHFELEMLWVFFIGLHQ